jgi:hypothetical protein
MMELSATNIDLQQKLLLGNIRSGNKGIGVISDIPTNYTIHHATRLPNIPSK